MKHMAKWLIQLIQHNSVYKTQARLAGSEYIRKYTIVIVVQQAKIPYKFISVLKGVENQRSFCFF